MAQEEPVEPEAQVESAPQDRPEAQVARVVAEGPEGPVVLEGQEALEALAVLEQLDLPDLLDSTEATASMASTAFLAPVAAPGVLAALVRQALLDLPAARAEVAVLEARAAREALAVLEALAPADSWDSTAATDSTESLEEQVVPGAQAAWVRPVPRAVQVGQAAREGRVARGVPERLEDGPL